MTVNTFDIAMSVIILRQLCPMTGFALLVDSLIWIYLFVGKYRTGMWIMTGHTRNRKMLRIVQVFILLVVPFKTVARIDEGWISTPMALAAQL